MKNMTKQMAEWAGEFGKEYTDRNLMSVEEMGATWKRIHGVSRIELNQCFVGDLDRSLRILEVGCNIGNQLLTLQQMGFTNLYGIELGEYALQIAQSRTENMHLSRGSALDIPYEDNGFDLVFTSGVLIHIHPDDIQTALREIHRCSRRFIWGAEYFAESYTKISYHGHEALLWKTNFSRLYLDTFGDLTLVKEEKIPYLDNDNVDSMFLLSKG